MNTAVVAYMTDLEVVELAGVLERYPKMRRLSLREFEDMGLDFVEIIKIMGRETYDHRDLYYSDRAKAAV